MTTYHVLMGEGEGAHVIASFSDEVTARRLADFITAEVEDDDAYDGIAPEFQPIGWGCSTAIDEWADKIDGGWLPLDPWNIGASLAPHDTAFVVSTRRMTGTVATSAAAAVDESAETNMAAVMRADMFYFGETESRRVTLTAWAEGQRVCLAYPAQDGPMQIIVKEFPDEAMAEAFYRRIAHARTIYINIISDAISVA